MKGYGWSFRHRVGVGVDEIWFKEGDAFEGMEGRRWSEGGEINAADTIG